MRYEGMNFFLKIIFLNDFDTKSMKSFKFFKKSCLDFYGNLILFTDKKNLDNFVKVKNK